MNAWLKAVSDALFWTVLVLAALSLALAFAGHGGPIEVQKLVAGVLLIAAAICLRVGFARA